MILYFSGTGNSKFVADFLAEYLEDSVVSLNDKIKHKEQLNVKSKKPLVLVAPIYAWRYPKVVAQMMHDATFQPNQEIYFVATMGSETGKCDKYCKKLAKSKGLIFKGFCGVPMPNNYVVSYHMSDEKEVRKGLKEAQDLLIQLGKIIKNGDFISKNDKTSMAAIKSGLVNSMFCRFASKGEVHTVSDQCMKCGTCEKFCPVNNITMDGDKPVFGKQCISCYGCIHRCPVEAINIQGKTEKNGRYVCPDYIEWKKSSR